VVVRCPKVPLVPKVVALADQRYTNRTTVSARPITETVGSPLVAVQGTISPGRPSQMRMDCPRWPRRLPVLIDTDRGASGPGGGGEK